MADLPLLPVQDLKQFSAADRGREFASLLVIKRLNAKTASNGNPFLSIELGDRGGSFSCTIFGDSPAFAVLKDTGEGGVIRFEGKVDFYQDRFSPRATIVTSINEEELAGQPDAIQNLVEVAPENAEELWAEFNKFIDGIRHDELRMTVRSVFEDIGDAFKWTPAAVAMHHAYRHGLLEHTVHMARACHVLLPLYPQVDADLAMAGVLVHDTGKTIEYEGSLASKRSRKGILQGHVVLGYQLVRKAGLKAKLDPDRLERLEHIVLSHQGEPAWGAAVYAATPEAVFVSMVDNLDAKMGMVQRLLRQADGESEFTERHMGLNSPLLTTPISEK